ncbi:hypothetical protein FNV43_RR19478 [Rhamnella rubrinervis]|uniref:Uncharacterized protein n=1 Tax=Rhamnella rubrinervis TaxID=2594499 RepID=A0A8K0DU47_9ROSA|nr:hypothetical protein FNV43_RR19478 [Rhamnella rubrinervis]
MNGCSALPHVALNAQGGRAYEASMEEGFDPTMDLQEALQGLSLQPKVEIDEKKRRARLEEVEAVEEITENLRRIDIQINNGKDNKAFWFRSKGKRIFEKGLKAVDGKDQTKIISRVFGGFQAGKQDLTQGGVLVSIT